MLRSASAYSFSCVCVSAGRVRITIRSPFPMYLFVNPDVTLLTLVEILRELPLVEWRPGCEPLRKGLCFSRCSKCILYDGDTTWLVQNGVRRISEHGNFDANARTDIGSAICVMKRRACGSDRIGGATLRLRGRRPSLRSGSEIASVHGNSGTRCLVSAVRRPSMVLVCDASGSESTIETSPSVRIRVRYDFVDEYIDTAQVSQHSPTISEARTSMRAIETRERGVYIQGGAACVKQVSLRLCVLRNRMHGELCVCPSDGCFLAGFVQASSSKAGPTSSGESSTSDAAIRSPALP